MPHHVASGGVVFLGVVNALELKELVEMILAPIEVLPVVTTWFVVEAYAHMKTPEFVSLVFMLGLWIVSAVTFFKALGWLLRQRDDDDDKHGGHGGHGGGAAPPTGTA